ncbi:hypothetical protein MJT46_012204 [Ovis ammon polii x Ovis aries]|nr:hypothetical protein MJT46_012204 [Ovis ammon polii x Ovis aries]
MGARARSPLRRVCGLDEFTLPSIPEYDHVGKREPCGCVWTRVNTDPGAATGALLCPGERLKGKPASSLRCTSWNFLINTLHSSWTRNRLKCNLVSAYVTGRTWTRCKPL